MSLQETMGGCRYVKDLLPTVALTLITGIRTLSNEINGVKQQPTHRIRPRFSLTTKVAMLLFVCTLSTATFFTVLDNRQLYAMAEERSHVDLQNRLAALVPHVEQEFAILKDDLRILSNEPTMLRMVEAQTNGGVHPQDGSTTDYWILQLQSLYQTMLKARPGFEQIRYMSVVDGREIVRVDRVDGAPVVRAKEDLELNAQRDYFQAAMRLQPGEIRFSRVDLNPGAAGTSDQETITLRVFTLVRDSAGIPRGVLVFYTRYRDTLDQLLTRVSPDLNVYVVDGSGNLYHARPDGSSDFVFRDQIEATGYRPVVDSLLTSRSGSSISATEHNDVERVFSVQSILKGYGPANEGLKIALGEDRSKLYESANQSLRDNLLLAAIAVLTATLIGIAVARWLVRPINAMRQALDNYAAGEPLEDLPIEHDDELGDFARKFARVADKLAVSRESEHRAFLHLKSILQRSIDGIMTLDSDGNIRRINPAALKMFGYPPERIIGRNLSMLLFDADFSDIERFLNSESRIGKGSSSGLVKDVSGVHHDGSVMDLEISLSKVPLPDGDHIFALFVRDISERLTAQANLERFASQVEKVNQNLTSANGKLEAANEDLRGFTYIVSHDLRAPLFNLMGFSADLNRSITALSEKLGERPSSEEDPELSRLVDQRIPKALEFINQAGDKMQTQLDIIVRLSRLGRYEMKPESVRLQDVFESTIASLSNGEVGEIDVRLRAVPALFIDPDAIQIIATNLISNVFRYRDPKRPLELNITASEDNESLTLCVADNGRGIREEDMDEIFKLFRRVGRQDTQGEGIGLSFVSRVVDRIGGKIWCESEFGVGTRFFVSIPRGQRESEAEVA